MFYSYSKRKGRTFSTSRSLKKIAIKPKQERAWKGLGLKHLGENGVVTDVTDVTDVNPLTEFCENQNIEEGVERVTSVTSVTKSTKNQKNCGK